MDGKGAGFDGGDTLLAFVDAAKGSDPDELTRSRAAVAEKFGAEGLVDAACVIGNFERMNRIADGTGIPVEPPVAALSSDLREELNLGSFGSASYSAAPGAGTKFAGSVLRKLVPLALRMQAKFGSRTKSEG
jgi:hypothetical protein